MTIAPETPRVRPNGPQFAQTDEETGRRWYIFDDDPTRYLSVSTVTGVIGSEHLLFWASGLAAKGAFIELPTIITASRTKACGRTYSKCKGLGPDQHDWRTSCQRCPCGTCRDCVTHWLANRHKAERDRRADEGSRAHDVVEFWILHGQIRDHNEDIALYVKAFEAFVAEYGLKPEDFLASECTVINRAYGYAGTCDGIVRIHASRTQAAAELVARVLFTRGEYQQHADDKDALIAAVVADDRHVDLVFDIKTQEKTRDKANWYPEQALQVTGYRHASVIRPRGGQRIHEVAMPDTDGGMLLQLRPDGATARLVVTDDTTLDAFLGFLTGARWLLEVGPKAVQVGSFALPKKAVRKATPRKAATAKATPAATKTAPPKKSTAAAAAPRAGAAMTRREQTAAALDPWAAQRAGRPFGAQLDDSDIPF